MANQYSGSFEHIIQKNFNCSAKEALESCIAEDLSYSEAEEKLGFNHGTIRKWAKRFGLKLKAGEPPQIKTEQFMNLFKEEAINKYNILSRSWLQIPPKNQELTACC